MPRPGPIILSPKGHRLTRNPARILYAAEQLRLMSPSLAMEQIRKYWKVHEVTAWRDISAAKQLIAQELDAIEVRAGEVRRNERIADKAEQAADLARARAEDATGSAADWGAVAQLQKTAIAASREISRLTGAYAPKEVKITHTGSIEVALRIDAVLLVLDARDHEDLARITAKILAAQAAGQIASAEDEEIEDAEIVEPDLGSGGAPGEN